MFTVALDAVTTAALLFIISSGLLIVFGVMKIINFAHAAFLTVGGYAALVGAQLRLPWLLVLPLTFIAGGVCGALTEAIIVRRLYQRPLDAILATWGLGIVIGLAMICNLVAAALGGVLIPLVLYRLRFDPAVSSGVFVTTVTDVVGFFSFLGIATLWFGLR